MKCNADIGFITNQSTVTNQDHKVSIGCWRRLEGFGAVIKEWQIDPQSGELVSIESLKTNRQLRKKRGTLSSSDKMAC